MEEKCRSEIEVVVFDLSASVSNFIIWFSRMMQYLFMHVKNIYTHVETFDQKYGLFHDINGRLIKRGLFQCLDCKISTKNI